MFCEMVECCVVAFGGAGIEDDLGGGAAREGGDLIACGFYQFAAFSPEAMDGGCVVGVLHSLAHAGDDFGADGRGGVVIEVNLIHGSFLAKENAFVILWDS